MLEEEATEAAMMEAGSVRVSTVAAKVAAVRDGVAVGGVAKAAASGMVAAAPRAAEDREETAEVRSPRVERCARTSSTLRWRSVRETT
jgi:hypothetical protein